VKVQEIIKAALLQDSEEKNPALQVQRVTTCPNFRHLPYWCCQPYFRSTRLEALTGDTVSGLEALTGDTPYILRVAPS